MVDFRAIIDKLVDIHFYDVFLPFILVYVIVYAVLEKAKIFNVTGEGSENSHVKNVNAVIAFVFGLFVVASIQTVMFIQNFILNVVLILIFLLCVFLVLGFIFGDEYVKLFKDESGNVRGWISWAIAIVAFLVVLGILFSILGVFDTLINWWDTSGSGDDIATIVVVLLIGLVLYWVTKSDSEKK